MAGSPTLIAVNYAGVLSVLPLIRAGWLEKRRQIYIEKVRQLIL